MDKTKLRIKKYWNKRPCNILHSKKKFQSREYFNEVRKKRYFVENHILKFADFKNYKNKNVLEIGCGIGTDACEFIKNGAKYYGVEYSEKSLEITKQRIKVLNLYKNNPNFFNLDAENLSQIKKLNIQFDLIYSFGVIHHTKNMKKCFNEIHKLSNKKTKIETKFESILILLNIEYEYQYEFKKRLFDFKINNKNILIEVDGDFYHCNPNTKHSEVMYESQKLTKKNDDYKNLLCKNNGMKLLRYWEKDINERPDWVILELKKELYLQKT